MSFGRRFGLVAALENEDLELPVEGEAADSAESSMLEMNEAAADVDAGTDAVEQTSADAEQLDAIADTMEASEETGGLDETSAAIAEVAVEAIYARLGVTRRKPLPAMESFGSSSTRLRSTKLAVEGIREMASKAWAAIVEFCKKIKDFFVRLWKFITDSAYRNEERAKKLAAKSGKIGSTPKEKEIAAGSFAKALTTGGKFEAGKIATGLEEIGTYIGNSKMQVDTLQAANKNAADSQTTKWSVDSFKRSATGKEISTEQKPRTGFKFLGFSDSAEMLGGVAVVDEVPDGEKSGKEAYELWSERRIHTVVSKAGEGFKAEKVATASPAEQKQIADGVVKLVKGVKEAQTAIKQATSLLDEAIKIATAASKGDNQEGAEDRSKLIRKYMTSNINAVVKGTKDMGTFGVKASKAALDYVEKSQAQYSANSGSTDLAVADKA